MKKQIFQIPIPETSQIQKLAYSVEEAAEALNLGRSSVLGLITEGRLQVVRVGRRVLVPVTECQGFLNRELAPPEGA